MELLYASGLRVAECCGLDLDDLDEARRTVRVLGKGDKERVVPVGETALEALAAYLAMRGPAARRRCSRTPAADGSPPGARTASSSAWPAGRVSASG